jgi:pimeloyl-ACP methyl ester carboxylesterase
VSLATDVHDTVDAVGFAADVAPLLVGHSLGGVVVSAYAALFGAAGVIDVDQPLRLAGFKAALAPIEPMVRGDQASCETAIGLVFESMHGPLPADELARIGSLRRVDQSVVAGVWGTVFDSTEDELDAQVGALAGGVQAPFLSLHGIDPGDDYAAWLTSVVPQAEVEVWADHGHYPHLVDQQRFLRRVDAFAATC